MQKQVLTGLEELESQTKVSTTEVVDRGNVDIRKPELHKHAALDPHDGRMGRIRGQLDAIDVKTMEKPWSVTTRVTHLDQCLPGLFQSTEGHRMCTGDEDLSKMTTLHSS